MANAPSAIETERLLLRRPSAEDAEAIFDRYASDAGVTRFLAWRRHASPDDTRAFIEFSDVEWQRWGAGPYLVERRSDGELIGGTGLALETPTRASTGYVLAKDAWGNGYATEALRAMVETASHAGIVRLYAICHVDHPASRRVLEKGGFEHEGVLKRHSVFPNLDPGEPRDVLSYARILR